MSTPPDNLHSIGNLPIVPAAEPGTPSQSEISGQQESEFFKQAGAQFALQQNQQNLGFLGKFFGASAQAPTNIAGLVALVSLLIVAASYFFSGNTELAENRKYLFGMISTSLAFIFGAASKK